MFVDSVKGAEASTVIYRISETVKQNNLSTYNYFNHLLAELPKPIDRDGNVINAKALESLQPWAAELPDICRKSRQWRTASLYSMADDLTLTSKMLASSAEVRAKRSRFLAIIV